MCVCWLCVCVCVCGVCVGADRTVDNFAFEFSEVELFSVVCGFDDVVERLRHLWGVPLGVPVPSTPHFPSDGTHLISHYGDNNYLNTQGVNWNQQAEGRTFGCDASRSPLD